MIQIYHPLYLVEAVVCFRQFSGEQGLLSGKHFQIGGATAVFHQLTGTFHGAAQGGYLLAIKLQTAVGCLPKDFCHGERLRLLGNELTLTLVQADKYFSPKIEDGKLLVAVNKTSDQTYVKEQTTKFINDLTVAEITKSMQKMSASTGLVPEKVTIKPLTASWGRCISNRHISINSKLIVFRRECIDYVCLHELCHLVFMDHSKDFWALVGKFCPDWRGIREEMKG